MWHGRWIPRCTDFPAWQARFVQAPRFTFIDVGHGQREAPGMRLGHLRESYLHDLSAGGEAEWLEKHRRYARAEAKHALNAPPPRWSALFSRDRLERRRTLKAIAARMPARPALRFVYQYILRGGFLDGAGALRYCYLLACYERFMAEEVRALRRSSAPTA
jgi:hypothetical protein